jgi:hypothetical protein
MKYAITTDWVQAMFVCDTVLPLPSADVPYTCGDVVFTPSVVQGNKYFSHSWEISLDGEAFAIAFSHSRTTIIAPDVVQVKIYNHHLYRSGWLSRLRMMCAAMRWHYKNVSRLDIAIDGVFDAIANTQTGEIVYERGLRSFIQEEYVANRKYVMMGKANLSASSLNPKTGNFAGFYIGKASSDKVLSIYDKSRELEQSCKQYIRDFWSECGLVDAGNVERVELRMRSACIKTIENFDFWRLDDAVYLASLARTQFENWFEFVPVSDDGNKSRRKDKLGSIVVIDWESVGAVPLTKRVVAPSEVFSCKVTIKRLHLMTQAFKITRPAAEIAISACVERGNLWNWYARKSIEWGGLPVEVQDGAFLDGGDALRLSSCDMDVVFDTICG